MTGADAERSNIAENSAVVVQAEAIHGSVTVYQLPPDAPPEQKYEIGRNWLDGGVPSKARELIYQAIIEGHATSEVWFHWMLAMLSGRTLRQFTDDDFHLLSLARHRIPWRSGDRWCDGLKVISRLLVTLRAVDPVEPTDGDEPDLGMVVKEFDELDAELRDGILRHLELFLTGPVEDVMWDRTLRRLRDRQTAHDRAERVWMFFEPKPVPPRVRGPEPIGVDAADWLLAVVTGAVAASATGYLGWLILTGAPPASVLVYLAAVVGCGVCAVTGARWRYRSVRRDVLDRRYRPPWQRATAAPDGGFADAVGRLFDRYFARYRPAAFDAATWLGETSGVRRYLRDEIVEAYRESRIGARRVAWLVRHRAREARQAWSDGTLLGHRRSLRTPPRTKAGCVAGLLVAVSAGLWSVGAAVQASPVGAAWATLALLAGGWVSGHRWLRIVLELWRYAAESAETRERLASSEAEYRRWVDKISRKPTDAEIATWLDCDRKVLIEQAMRHYRLTPSNVIVHTVLEAPAADRYKRARVRNGPWRYSRYQLLVFLLTRDGVRQFTAVLDFERATFHDRRRLNYRFDAVAAVEVVETDEHERVFELSLVDGQSITARVTESNPVRQLGGEDPQALSVVTLDATGLASTLHVLEGVAAEGRTWIEHERRRGRGRSERLGVALHGLTS